MCIATLLKDGVHDALRGRVQEAHRHQRGLDRILADEGDKVEYLEDLWYEGAVAKLGQELRLALGDGLGELGCNSIHLKK